MLVIIATDIFGITPSVKSLQKNLTEILIESIIIDPFQGEVMEFKEESDAYNAYLDNCGHEQYKQLVEEVIFHSAGNLVVIGFSAGASALWRALSDLLDPRIEHYFGFYPSQIRNHLNAIPSQTMTLIFPESEEYFDVELVMSQLSCQVQIEIIHSQYLHGFMNPYSKNFSSTASTKYNQILLSFFKHKTKLPH